MIKKILSWFKFKKYIKITHRDPVSFEMDQLIRKNQEPSKNFEILCFLKIQNLRLQIYSEAFKNFTDCIKFDCLKNCA